MEVGRGFFETEKKHFTILDAPGHKSFVPNMIGGASQADLAVLVISARKGEFETGFERGGQTREHAMLVKTAGVKHMVVLINKMDDPTVQWDKARYLSFIMHIDTLILLVIIVKIVSFHDLSLRATWAGHWLLVCLPAKGVLRDTSWKEIIFKISAQRFNVYRYLYVKWG